MVAGCTGLLTVYRDRERVKLRGEIVVEFQDTVGQLFRLPLDEAARKGKLDAGPLSVYITAVNLGSRTIHIEKRLDVRELPLRLTGFARWKCFFCTTGVEETPERLHYVIEQGETTVCGVIPLDDSLLSVSVISTTGRRWKLTQRKIKRLRSSVRNILTTTLPPLHSSTMRSS